MPPLHGPTLQIVVTLVAAAAPFTLAWQVAPMARAQSIVFLLFVCTLASLASC